jgi:hypothetical protein
LKKLPRVALRSNLCSTFLHSLMSLKSRGTNPYTLNHTPHSCQDFPEHLSMAGINPELRRQVINVYKGTLTLRSALSSFLLTRRTRAARDGQVLSIGLFLFPVQVTQSIC